jgi:hypothetical protein
MFTRNAWCCVMAIAFAALAGVAIGWHATTSSQVGDKRPEMQEIPLGSVYSGSRQKDLVHTGHLEPLFRDTPFRGASNIFLVGGDDIKQAMLATRHVLLAGSSGRIIANPPDAPQPKSVWMFAYFGIGPSEPPAVLIDSVKHGAKIVRLNFSLPERQSTTADAVAYCYWAPLGEVPKGRYTLELYDINLKEVMLMRCVEIIKDN